MKAIIIAALIALSFYSCGGNTAGHSYAGTPEVMPLPELPDGIDSVEAPVYLLNHFWDALDFNDTLRSHNRDFIEQNFANFSQVLIMAGDSVSRRDASRILMKKAEVDTAAYRLMADVAYHYLYDPNSPLLDEESYIPFLEIFSESQFLDEAQRGRNRFLLEAALKNRPGMIAADFPYETLRGEKTSLHATPVKGNLLLIFYDPDCDNCKEIIGDLSSNHVLNEMIEKGDLTVLAVYSGEEREMWLETNSMLPQSWIVGYDAGTIDRQDSYYFRATPTIYLLDKDKRVIFKDLPASTLLM